MTSQGASLQNCNNQLVACLEELKEQRGGLDQNIEKVLKEKSEIEKQLAQLSKELALVNENLSKKIQARNEFDRTIQETEGAYMKILESSQTLLHVLKRESTNLNKRISDS
ncbi:SSNA1_3 [Blepharisma stoltei]|uniref:Sjoegren syndrome nuclear autoantigen 1 n=1 Tax=Blepharisma stoltei TaxID=1481888 RepID=A0AAU9J6T0_9CILI|nr:unnamed protein product [Blepharisma stoltei]